MFSLNLNLNIAILEHNSAQNVINLNSKLAKKITFRRSCWHCTAKKASPGVAGASPSECSLFHRLLAPPAYTAVIY